MPRDLDSAIAHTLSVSPDLAFQTESDSVDAAHLGPVTYRLCRHAGLITACVTDAGGRVTPLYHGRPAAPGYTACRLHAGFQAMGVDISVFPVSADRPYRRTIDRVRGYELVVRPTGNGNTDPDIRDRCLVLRDPEDAIVTTVACPYLAGLHATAHALAVTARREPVAA